MTHPGEFKSIVLVDDHPMVRERLCEVINQAPGLKVCGEAEDRAGALELIGRTRPHLAIVDLSLKHSHGMDLIKDLRAMYPEVRILVVSMQEESLYAERAIRAGAHGYITKQEATRKVLLAISKVLSGGVYLSDTMTTQLMSRMVGRTRAGSPVAADCLADRELQVFERIGRGVSTRRIAEELGVDVKTVETYRARIKEKLHLKDASELLQRAIAWMNEGKEG